MSHTQKRYQIWYLFYFVKAHLSVSAFVFALKIGFNK